MAVVSCFHRSGFILLIYVRVFFLRKKKKWWKDELWKFVYDSLPRLFEQEFAMMNIREPKSHALNNTSCIMTQNLINSDGSPQLFGRGALAITTQLYWKTRTNHLGLL